MSNISTALQIAEASKNAVNNPFVMMAAKQMLTEILGNDELPSDKVIRALYKYSAILSSATASHVTDVLMSESELDTMLDSIKEFEDMSDEITGGNN